MGDYHPQGTMEKSVSIYLEMNIENEFYHPERSCSPHHLGLERKTWSRRQQVEWGEVPDTKYCSKVTRGGGAGGSSEELILS